MLLVDLALSQLNPAPPLSPYRTLIGLVTIRPAQNTSNWRFLRWISRISNLRCGKVELLCKVRLVFFFSHHIEPNGCCTSFHIYINLDVTRKEKHERHSSLWRRRLPNQFVRMQSGEPARRAPSFERMHYWSEAFLFHMLMFVLPCRRKPASADAAACLRWVAFFFLFSFFAGWPHWLIKSSRSRWQRGAAAPRRAPVSGWLEICLKGAPSGKKECTANWDMKHGFYYK